MAQMVNGEPRQHSSAEAMTFTEPETTSGTITREPGDSPTFR